MRQLRQQEIGSVTLFAEIEQGQGVRMTGFVDGPFDGDRSVNNDHRSRTSRSNSTESVGAAPLGFMAAI